MPPVVCGCATQTTVERLHNNAEWDCWRKEWFERWRTITAKSLTPPQGNRATAKA
jgi:hypothetical protein